MACVVPYASGHCTMVTIAKTQFACSMVKTVENPIRLSNDEALVKIALRTAESVPVPKPEIVNPVRPKKGQVWAFHGGPRHDIVKSVKRCLAKKNGKLGSAMYVQWESGMITLPVREVWEHFQYKGFFFKLS